MTAPIGDDTSRSPSLGSLPLLVFTAARQPDPGLRDQMEARGIDTDRLGTQWPLLQRELAAWSTRSQHFTLDATHTTLVTERKHAAFIAARVRALYEQLDGEGNTD